MSSKSFSKSFSSSIFLAALALAGASCKPDITCSPINCTNGCCDATGSCILTETAAACGLGAVACFACSNDLVCSSGSCVTPPPDAGVRDGGVDPCASKSFDPALGRLQLDGGAHVVRSAALPAGVGTVALAGGQLYGLSLDSSVRALGSLPSLSLGPTLGQARSPADDAADAAVYLSSSISVSGSQLLVGYTRADYSGALAIIDLADAGTRWVEAPSSYTWAASSTGFLVNGGGLGSEGVLGIYALETLDGGSSGFLLAPFASTWMASSGFTAVTPAGVGLFGYFDGVNYQNVVRAVPAPVLSAALVSRAALDLTTSASEVARGASLGQVTALGESMILVLGGYDTAAFTSSVVRVPLVVNGTTVATGSPVTLLTAPDHCTTVSFLTSDGTTLLLGLTDRTGSRVIELAP